MAHSKHVQSPVSITCAEGYADPRRTPERNRRTRPVPAHERARMFFPPFQGVAVRAAKEDMGAQAEGRRSGRAVLR